MRPRAPRQHGFTLFEMVIVIAITALLAGVLGSFINRPMEGFTNTVTRAHLVSMADHALQRLARDLRDALPNSMRVEADPSNPPALEFLHAVDGARYRRGPGINPSTQDHTDPADWLDFGVADTQFNVLSPFENMAYTSGTALPTGYRIAIYTTSPAEIYSDAVASVGTETVITPASTSITVSVDADGNDEDKVTLSPGHDFSHASPRQRLYVVDTPVTFLCDLSAGAMLRYSGYAISQLQPVDPSIAPLDSASSALAASGVTDCEFIYSPGSPTRSGLVTIIVGLSQGGEQIKLVEQVHVTNAP